MGSTARNLIAGTLVSLSVLAVPAAANAATPTATRQPIGTVAPTKTPPVTGTREPTFTPRATGTPMPTRVPSPRIQWAKEWLEPTLEPGVASAHAVTFTVTQPIANASARSASVAGVEITEPIPTTLVPGQTYTLRLMLTLPEDRTKWPLRGQVLVRSGTRSLGTVLFIRGFGPRGSATPGASPSQGPFSTATPTRSGPMGTGTATATQRPEATRKPGPTSTPTSLPLRTTWGPTTLVQEIELGGAGTADVTLSVTRRVVLPRFRVFARDGAVKIDPASIPGTLEPGQSYTLRLLFAMPAGRRASPHTGTILLRDENRSYGQGLMIKLKPLR